MAFIFYIFGLVTFVLNLKEGHYKFQFSQLSLTIMSLLFIVVQSHFVVKNIKEGLVWFVIPSLLVIANDVFAYLIGKSIGRTKLLKISPKKTLEGYLGGLISTVLLSVYIIPKLFAVKYLACPVKVTIHDLTILSKDINMNIFNAPDCKIEIVPTNILIHSIVLSSFASIVAPFGGFLASGFKRAFKIKDFSGLIPGHGGFADRMDCQFIMGLFTYLYVHNFIKVLMQVYCRNKTRTLKKFSIWH